jgi:hypothetical protein
MYNAIFKIMSMAYAMILRNLLIKAIDDPEEEWDDHVLLMCDTLFGYKEGA